MAAQVSRRHLLVEPGASGRSKQGVADSVHPMQRFLIIAGIVLLAAGLAWPWISRLPLGRLPGDIHIVREGFSFHFPVVTSIVVSLVISFLVWFFRR